MGQTINSFSISVRRRELNRQFDKFREGRGNNYDMYLKIGCEIEEWIHVVHNSIGTCEGLLGKL
jgi:hypothetical protein